MENEILDNLTVGNPINLFDYDRKEFVKFMLNRDSKKVIWKQMISESQFKNFVCRENELSKKDVSDIINGMKRKKFLPKNNN